VNRKGGGNITHKTICKDKIIQRYVKIKLIRGMGQKIYKCSRKCSPTAYGSVEDPQKLTKMFMMEYRRITKMFAKCRCRM